jgi:hypothetical protein
MVSALRRQLEIGYGLSCGLLVWQAVLWWLNLNEVRGCANCVFIFFKCKEYYIMKTLSNYFAISPQQLRRFRLADCQSSIFELRTFPFGLFRVWFFVKIIEFGFQLRVILTRKLPFVLDSPLHLSTTASLEKWWSGHFGRTFYSMVWIDKYSECCRRKALRRSRSLSWTCWATLTNS